MIPPREILVATDRSAGSAGARRWAIGAARRFDARVHVVYSCDVQRLALMPGAFASPDEFWSHLRGGAEKVVEDAASEVRDAGLECVVHLEQIEPSAAIRERAEKIPADLIVMGTHGERGPTRWMLGSTAARTVRTAPCPVVTVRDSPQVETATFERIIVGVDFSKPAQYALDVARKLAAATGAELLLVHADYVPAELSRWVDSGRAAGSLARLSAAGDRQLAAELALLRDEGIRAEALKPFGTAELVLEKAAEDQGASLVVVGTHGRTGFTRAVIGSVAERVIRIAPCPVLSVSAEVS